MSANSWYRFYTADLLTGAVLGEIEPYNCNLDMGLGEYGNFEGTLPLGQGSAADALDLSITQPARTALYVERNDELIWGGIIWSRIWDEDEQTYELGAQTFDSFYERTVLEHNFVRQNTEQVTILQNLVSRVNGQDGGNIGITGPSTFTTGINKTVLIPAYEFHYAIEVIQQLTDGDQALEYTVQVADSATPDQPTKTIIAASTGSLNTGSSITLDYPGTMNGFTWPENGFQGGNKFAGRGGGAGNQAPTATFIDQTSRAAGYPSLWSVYNYPDIIDRKTVKRKTRRMFNTQRVPITTPTFRIDADQLTTHWQHIGMNINFNIDSFRFPNGLSGTRRMMGWRMTFLDENNPESVTLLTDDGATV